MSTQVQVLERLAEIIESRKLANGGDPDKSYVARLFSKGDDAILKKIGEEASEVIIADQHQDKEEIIEESCDLLYHLFVMWENSGVDLYDIMRKLEERDEKKGNKKKVGHQDKIF